MIIIVRMKVVDRKVILLVPVIHQALRDHHHHIPVHRLPRELQVIVAVVLVVIQTVMMIRNQGIVNIVQDVPVIQAHILTQLAVQRRKTRCVQ